MKRWFSAILLLMVLAIAGIYFLIPRNLKVASVRTFSSTTNAAFKSISDEKYREKWWTGSTGSAGGNNKMPCGQYRFEISKKLYNAVEIKVSAEDETLVTNLALFQMNPDSIGVRWQTSIVGSLNPMSRVLQYWQARDLKMCMDQKLKSLEIFLKKSENIYGFDIQRTTLQDTVLVSTKSTFRSYPTTEEVYTLIEKLKLYIRKEGAAETNLPMLNIISNKDSSYLAIVAIATNKALPGNNEIFFKRLVRYQNKVLTTEVKGGLENIKKAFTAIESYMTDHHLTPPVIPFELLITDRRSEDESTWITRIYYPVI